MGTFAVTIRENIRQNRSVLIIYSVLFILMTDFTYKTIAGITYHTKEKCVIYAILPRWFFLIYENCIELALTVLAGIYFAVILENYISSLGKLLPRNQLTAFIYASLLPVCSCSVIPFTTVLYKKTSTRTMITFLTAAPILNPYNILLSFSVIGWQFALLRIAAAFAFAYTAGLAVEIFGSKSDLVRLNTFVCRKTDCSSESSLTGADKALKSFKTILPYLLVASSLTLLFEYSGTEYALKFLDFENSRLNVVLLILTGIPLYLCNGADILFLKPFLLYGGLPTNAAIAFSLTSTSVCISSYILLIKYLGSRNTLIIFSVLLLTVMLLLLPLFYG